MPPRVSLSAYLANAKSILSTPTHKVQPLTFVVGNESADLDSLCSALLLAYLRTYAPPHTLHVPLCNLPRGDLTLRPEFTEILKRVSASPNDVITLDELSMAAHTDGFMDNTHWLLVDHNSLTGKLESYRDRVIGCIDHHADEGHVAHDSSPRVIEKSGSCTSLVVNYCKDAWDGLKSLEHAAVIDSQLAHLALGPILIDTNNLEDENKTTTFDKDAVQYLEKKIGGPAGYDRGTYFTTVSVLKEDISMMSMRDILRKDYKEWETGGLKLGTSSVPADFLSLEKKAGGVETLIQTIEEWGNEKSLDLVTLMTAFQKDGNFCRQLLLVARSDEAIAAARRFEHDYKTKLELSPWEEGKLDLDNNHAWRKCWSQARVENSRKQVAPMLRQAMGA